jgi:hypothetical protein
VVAVVAVPILQLTIKQAILIVLEDKVAAAEAVFLAQDPLVLRIQVVVEVEAIETVQVVRAAPV